MISSDLHCFSLMIRLRSRFPFGLGRISTRRNEWRFRREIYLGVRIFTCL